MNNIDQKIKDLSVQMDYTQGLINFMVDNQMTLNDCKFEIVFSSGCSRVVINKLSDLHEARAFMTRLYGSWKDTFIHSFFSAGVTISTWKDKNHPWAIWLECPINEFPKELLPSDTCHWETYTSNKYSLVCEKE